MKRMTMLTPLMFRAAAGKPITEGEVVRRAWLKSRRWDDGGAWQRVANDARWKVAA